MSVRKVRRLKAQIRRDALLAANKCINSSLDGDTSKRTRIVHGPVVSKRRCQRCLDVRRVP